MAEMRNPRARASPANCSANGRQLSWGAAAGLHSKRFHSKQRKPFSRAHSRRSTLASVSNPILMALPQIFLFVFLFLKHVVAGFVLDQDFLDHQGVKRSTGPVGVFLE